MSCHPISKQVPFCHQEEKGEQIYYKSNINSHYNVSILLLIDTFCTPTVISLTWKQMFQNSSVFSHIFDCCHCCDRYQMLIRNMKVMGFLFVCLFWWFLLVSLIFETDFTV